MTNSLNNKLEYVLLDPNSSEKDRILATCILDLKSDLKYIKKLIYTLISLQVTLIVTIISIVAQH